MDEAFWGFWLRYASIPIVAAAIGYGTNVLAVIMMFAPLEYIGFGEAFFRKWGFSLGWQGIVPANAEKMARKTVKLFTEGEKALFNVREIFEEIDPAEVARALKPVLPHSVRKVVDAVAAVHAPDVWESLPLSARHELVEEICERAPPYIVAMMDDMKENIDDLLDLEELVVEKLLEDKNLMNEMFQRCGETELRFLERSGLYFGFLLGIVQAVLWYWLQQSYDQQTLWWFLPAAGAVCGYVTNALALYIIFNPVEKTQLGCFSLHGLFLQRQVQVSSTFAHISAEKVLNTRNLWERIMFGPCRHVLEGIVTRQVGPLPPTSAPARGPPPHRRVAAA